MRRAAVLLVLLLASAGCATGVEHSAGPSCDAPECGQTGTGYGLYPYGASQADTPAGMVCNWVSATEKDCVRQP